MSEHGHDNDMILLDDPEAGSTWFISLASVVLFTVTVLALSAMYFDFEGGEVDEKITAAPVKSLQELRLSQEELVLCSPRGGGGGDDSAADSASERERQI